ncbi:MAG: hypothetical protein RR497_04280 [Oscillospiraceae bacterium]
MDEPKLSLKCPVASYIWNVPYYSVDSTSLFDFCARNGVTQLYLAIHDRITNASYINWIKTCNAHGVEAIALVGDGNWVFPQGRSHYLNTMDRLDTINEMCKDGPKFKAVHFDVQPYVAPILHRYKIENYEPLLVNFIKEVKQRLETRQLRLEWDIPAWFTGRYDEENMCSLAETVFRLCDVVGVMAYRDSASDQLDLAMPHTIYAKKYNKVLIIGCETMKLDENQRPDGNCYISYFEEGKRYLYHSLEMMYERLNPIHSQIGFAIHDMPRWMELQSDLLPEFKLNINN